MFPLIAFFASFIVSALATIPTIKLAKKFNLVTDKTKRKHPAHTHIGIIPRAGGVPIYVALLVCTIIFIPINKIVFGILLSSLALVILGLMDDYYDLSPYLRLITNLFVSALVITFGLGIPFISNPLGGIIRLDQWYIVINFLGKHGILVIADILSTIWLAWTMNMVNFSKGVDGQLPGFVGITAFFLGILAQRFTAHDISVQSVTLLSFIIAGAYLGFAPFNFYPQKIMPGYGGGSLAGFLLGVLSILSFGKFGTFFLILAIPMIDAIYTVMRRLRAGHSPFRGDRGHLHHRLLDIGWGKRRIAIFYWLVSLLLGIASLFLKGMEKLLAFLSIAIFLLLFILVIEKIKKTTLK